MAKANGSRSTDQFNSRILAVSPGRQAAESARAWSAISRRPRVVKTRDRHRLPFCVLCIAEGSGSPRYGRAHYKGVGDVCSYHYQLLRKEAEGR